jgi:TolA-binding protein
MTDLEWVAEIVRAAQDDTAVEARDLSAVRARLLAPPVAVARRGSQPTALARGGVQPAAVARKRSRSAVRWALTLPALAAAAALVVWFGSDRARPLEQIPAHHHAERLSPLSYSIGGGASRSSASALSAAASDVDVRFDDGSMLTLARGSTAEINAPDAHGARVEVRGHLRARVHHAEAPSWRFIAGPYEIFVVGTSFDLQWNEAQRELELTLLDGEVRVEGPGLINRRVTTGETLRATADGSEHPPPHDAQLPAAPDALRRVVTRPAPPAAPNVVAVGTVAQTSPVERALAHAESGQHADAVRDLDDATFARALREANAHTLVELGDSARLAGRHDRARSALLTVRARFAASTEAQRAVFVLGRLAVDHDHDSAAARRYFERYLADAPNGVFARESLGRAMEARVALHQDARDQARLYLARYPNGPHAVLAAELLRAAR